MLQPIVICKMVLQSEPVADELGTEGVVRTAFTMRDVSIAISEVEDHLNLLATLKESNQLTLALQQESTGPWLAERFKKHREWVLISLKSFGCHSSLKDHHAVLWTTG